MANYNIDKKRLEVLASKLKDGSEKAFDEIFYTTKDYLFYYIFSIIKNQTQADDILQDTFRSVYINISNYKSKNFLSWIITIAHNNSVNYIRKESKMIYLEDDSSNKMSVGSKDDEILLLKDMENILNQNELEIVMMHVLGNFTHKQISIGLDKPIGTITWRYNEALKKLRTKLEVRYE